MTTPPVGGPGAAGSIPDTPPTCYRHTDRETWIRCQRCERPICPDCMNSAVGRVPLPELRQGGQPGRAARPARRTADSGSPTRGSPSFVLIGINVAVWLLIQATGGRAQHAGRQAGAAAPTSRRSCPARPTAGVPIDWLLGVADGAWWQIVTSMFTHVEPLHIGFNMLALYFLGPMLENVLGRTRFLALYLVSGIAGSAAVMLLSDPHRPDPGRLGRDLRADGSAGRGRAEGARPGAVGADLDRAEPGLHLHRGRHLLAGPHRWPGRRRARRRGHGLRPAGSTGRRCSGPRPGWCWRSRWR